MDVDFISDEEENFLKVHVEIDNIGSLEQISKNK